MFDSICNDLSFIIEEGNITFIISPNFINNQSNKTKQTNKQKSKQQQTTMKAMIINSFLQIASIIMVQSTKFTFAFQKILYPRGMSQIVKSRSFLEKKSYPHLKYLLSSPTNSLTLSFGIVTNKYDSPFKPLYASITSESSTSTSIKSEKYTDQSIKGIDWVRNILLDVLNESFDPAEVARGAALAKLEGNKKKKKKKKKSNDDTNQQEAQAQRQAQAQPELSEEEKQAIGDAAAAAAKPFSIRDVMVTPATRLEFGDYQCNAAMGLAKNVGMSPRLVNMISFAINLSLSTYSDSLNVSFF